MYCACLIVCVDVMPINNIHSFKSVVGDRATSLGADSVRFLQTVNHRLTDLLLLLRSDD